MFGRCQNLSKLNPSNWDVSNVENMRMMFNECNNLSGLDLTNWNTSNVTDMRDMFSMCTSLKTIYASDSFTTTAVTNSTDMFTYAIQLV
jgi:surface protein